MSNLFENWDNTRDALLEGLEGTKRDVMSSVLENTKVALNESATAGATQAGNIATLNKVILPVIRRKRNHRCSANDWPSWSDPHTTCTLCR
jgi:hypothetical protein